jgi:TetR/AcrR family transcriptional repressor for divergent bdcA
MTKKILRPRGRPRQFDPDEAVAVAQRLFHARGYDDVSVADVTGALGINTPSFYAAFGSKAGLFARVITRYADNGAIPLAALLRADRSVADGLAAVLEEAARRYAADPAATGCIVLAACGCGDPAARTAACAARAAAEQLICDFIAARHPEKAAGLTEYVSTLMLGLSAKARLGQSPDRLLATARLAGLAVVQALPG